MAEDTQATVVKFITFQYHNTPNVRVNRVRKDCRTSLYKTVLACINYTTRTEQWQNEYNNHNNNNNDEKPLN